MHKKIIVAGFGAIGKTVVGNKYDNIIDLESSNYKWDNTGYDNIKPEGLKGIVRPINVNWPSNYYKAILEATKKYNIVLTSMHDYVLKFFEENDIEYYLAIPTLDSVGIIIERCYNRGNNKKFIDILIKTLYDFDSRLNEYHPIKVLRLNKNEYLEDLLKRENLI